MALLSVLKPENTAKIDAVIDMTNVVEKIAYVSPYIQSIQSKQGKNKYKSSPCAWRMTFLIR